jgi:hypothetical protein
VGHAVIVPFAKKNRQFQAGGFSWIRCCDRLKSSRPPGA